MQVYELGYLILPSIGEAELPGVVSKLKELISKAGGKDFDGEAPFKQDLSYSMSKTVGASRYVVTDAYLGWMKFEADPSELPSIKVGIEKVEEILRFLLIKAPRESAFTFAKAREALEKLEEVEPVLDKVEAVEAVVE